MGFLDKVDILLRGTQANKSTQSLSSRRVIPIMTCIVHSPSRAYEVTLKFDVKSKALGKRVDNASHVYVTFIRGVYIYIVKRKHIINSYISTNFNLLISHYNKIVSRSQVIDGSILCICFCFCIHVVRVYTVTMLIINTLNIQRK